MKILVMNCSPVRDGATARIAELAASYVQDGNCVRSVCIDDYDIKLCRGCRRCHVTAECFQQDDTVRLMEQFEWADAVILVSPSYWADVPGQFKVFIDRCTPWCDTHEPHASLSPGKRGYAIALRTGPNMPECQKIIGTIAHFYGHLKIEMGGGLGLCSVEYKENVEGRRDEIEAFCRKVVS